MQTKRELKAEVVRLTYRVRELEERLCPCESHDWKVDECPTINPESLRPKGEWIEVKAKNFYGCMITAYECTNCKKHSVGQIAITMKSDFCPNCGADMRGDKNEC